MEEISFRKYPDMGQDDDDEEQEAQSEPTNNKMTSSQTVVVDKDASPDLGSKSKAIDKH